MSGLVKTYGVGADLPDNAYRHPRTFRLIVPTKDYRAVMLSRQGRILAAGEFWAIMGKGLGSGLVEITLVPSNV